MWSQKFNSDNLHNAAFIGYSLVARVMAAEHPIVVLHHIYEWTLRENFTHVKGDQVIPRRDGLWLLESDASRDIHIKQMHLEHIIIM